MTSRIPQDHALAGKAIQIPISSPEPVISISPVTLNAPDRLVDIQMRISAPSTSEDTKFPILLLSHGHGASNHLSSLNGYGPLANFWAAHGFVVIQPTHLSSKTLSLPPSTPSAPLFWRSRVQDMSFIIDHLDEIESLAPFIKGRLDRSRIAVAGHSAGGHTASLLLGATLLDPEDDNKPVEMVDARIKAGVLLAVPGNGNNGADLSEFANEKFPFFKTHSFDSMTMPALVVVGDEDVSPHLTVRGADWHADPYTCAPGPKTLLTLKGGKHGLGGISGFDAGETTDENIERVAIVQRATWAWLRAQLYPEEGGVAEWEQVQKVVEGELGGLASVESK